MKSLLIPMSYTPVAEACAKKAADLSGPDITVLDYRGLDGAGAAVSFGSGLPVLRCEGKAQLLGALAEADTVILVTPDFTDLYGLASGECTDDMSQAVLRALLWGIRIRVLVDYEIPRHARDNFFGKLNDTFDALRTLGIDIDTCGGGRVYAKPLTLVTENDVMAAGKSGVEEIFCTDRAIVTQLAEDLAKEMNIRIVRDREC